MQRGTVASASTFDRHSRRDPGVDAARERPHTLEAALQQRLCDSRGGRLVGARAIDDDLALRFDGEQVNPQIVEIDRYRAWNPAGDACDIGERTSMILPTRFWDSRSCNSSTVTRSIRNCLMNRSRCHHFRTI